MADFAAWVIAAEPALGWAPGSFLRAYVAGANEAQGVVLEASVIGEPVRALVEEVRTWEGTAAELLAALASRVSEETRRSKAWPRSARGITSPLRRIAPTLRTIGIEITFDRATDRSRSRIIRLQAMDTATTVQTVQPSDIAAAPDDSDCSDGFQPDLKSDELSHELGWELEISEVTS
jgi:hypothetical protein